MRKTKKTHPYLLIISCPKGHFMGNKKSEEIRRLRYKTLQQMLSDKESLIKTGAKILKESN